MSLLKSKTERVRFLKFSFVGVTGTIVDFGIMNLLRIALHMPLIWSQAISFFCAVINNFLWNRYWTYPESRDKGIHHQLSQFFIINVIGILIRTPLITWFDRILVNILNRGVLDLPIENYVLSQNIALTLSIAIILFWNFFANRYWTYSNVPTDIDINSE
jgi:putative flippase GtrA